MERTCILLLPERIDSESGILILPMFQNLSPYCALAFDFDGVILDSMTYKFRTFASLFEDHPEHLAEIDVYNRSKRGINRHLKFPHIFKQILHLPHSEEIGIALGKEYGRRLEKNLSACLLVPGVEAFLRSQSMPLFVASSSPSDEIIPILEAKGIRQLFREVYGHPLSKADALQKIAEELNCTPDHILFFGDASADCSAAEEAGAAFIAVTNEPDIFPPATRTIADFSTLAGTRKTNPARDVRGITE